MASFIENLLGLNQGDPLVDAAAKNKKYIKSLDATGSGLLNENIGIADDYLDLGKSGAGLYADAMGLGGADGTARATEAFQAGPGYQFGMDQGLDAVMRKASATGRVQSGNTDLDLMRFATGYADQNFGSWLDRLGGYNNMYTTGVGGSTKARGDMVGFKEGITQGLIDTRNQKAEGEATNNAGPGQLLSNIVGTAGKFMGYGGF